MDKHKKITLLLVGMLFALNIFTNIFLRVRIEAYQMVKLCHEKLAVAYDVGGTAGLKKELAIISANNQGKLYQEFLRRVENKVNNSENPRELLRSNIHKEAIVIRNTRIALLFLSTIIFIILFARIARYKKAALKNQSVKL